MRNEVNEGAGDCNGDEGGQEEKDVLKPLRGWDTVRVWYGDRKWSHLVGWSRAKRLTVKARSKATSLVQGKVRMQAKDSKQIVFEEGRLIANTYNVQNRLKCYIPPFSEV